MPHLLSGIGQSRRTFMITSAAGGLGLFAANLLAQESALASMPLAEGAVTAPIKAQNVVKVALSVNDHWQTLELDSRTVLLDALREHLGLTGSKKGCDQGQCGACTVLINGKRVLACLTLTASLAGRKVTTIEGLAQGERLHPVQAAFIQNDAFQCGYCTPGQICSAVGMLDEAQRGDISHVSADPRQPVAYLSNDEIRERMSGNICRCGAYPGIVAAVQQVHSGRQAVQTWGFASETQLAMISQEGGHETV
ncbi:2Fe-2S iron-sulfur cluster-binding protein [Pseudomonas ovata]|uniref:2Fe-2S iron-sulfur cluster-binding protein n=1 Tax=Pseudomonas ovata TaxID=1839709 RepID=UPI003BAC8C2B